MASEHHLEGLAEQQKKVGAEQVSKLARAIDGAADELGKEMPTAAQYVHAAAARLKSGADVLNERSVNELVTGVDQFARKQPIAVFGTAVLAGFALSRFLKSTANGS